MTPGPDYETSHHGRSALFCEFLDYPVWVGGARKDRVVNTDDLSLVDNHCESFDEGLTFHFKGG